MIFSFKYLDASKDLVIDFKHPVYKNLSVPRYNISWKTITFHECSACPLRILVLLAGDELKNKDICKNAAGKQHPCRNMSLILCDSETNEISDVIFNFCCLSNVSITHYALGVFISVTKTAYKLLIRYLNHAEKR